MKFYIPFIDELIREKGCNVQTDIPVSRGVLSNGGDQVWVVAEPMSWQGWLGVRERAYKAWEVWRGRARAFRYMKTEADVVEARGRLKEGGNP